MVWYSHLFQNFPKFIVIHTVKDFGIVNKAEIDVFLELSCFSDDPEDVSNLISGSSAFSETSLNIWEFMVHVLLKPGLEIILSCNCVFVSFHFVDQDPLYSVLLKGRISFPFMSLRHQCPLQHSSHCCCLFSPYYKQAVAFPSFFSLLVFILKIAY